ncbi:hypothetical protein C7B62_12915 [Pleurocapsa sp. CCALA 161]|uniref:hypothetical protein n=1 Tax=Pleurocapsa sp. CCALA 161 TaxID=2107688 RepID=UPI000D0619E7|nr:hypothetical protein [Pleurocapsa sp. CCALA 161]PSB09507.1 hypothetical protein C7B62_12915 [Pleurocapsa sp. CCALA 161]
MVKSIKKGKLEKNNLDRWRLKHRLVFFGIVTAMPLASFAIALSTTLALSNENNEITRSTADYPIVESAGLDTNLDVPWSEPVLVKDPFEGEFVGIFDRHFFHSRILDTSARLEVVSLWSPDTVRFLLSLRDKLFEHGFATRLQSWFEFSASNNK